jgi:hypothetical protein
VIRFSSSSFQPAASSSGASYSNSGGYHNYTFTGSGSITI